MCSCEFESHLNFGLFFFKISKYLQNKNTVEKNTNDLGASTLCSNFFKNGIKTVSYSFSSSVIKYNSNEKLLEAWSGARFYKNQNHVLSWYLENSTL